MNKKLNKGFGQSAKKEKGRGVSLLVSSAFGVFSGLLSFAVLTFLFSALCLGFEDAHSAALPLCFAAVYLAAFAGGFSASLKNGRTDLLLCGAITGALYVLLLFVLLFRFRDGGNGVKTVYSLLFRLLAVVCSIAGSFVGGRRKSAKKRKNF